MKFLTKDQIHGLFLRLFLRIKTYESPDLATGILQQVTGGPATSKSFQKGTIKFEFIPQ
jgi:hypothetical protein